MTFSVTLPISGYAGWNFLKRTQEKQQALLSQNLVQQRDESYFREKIGTILRSGHSARRISIARWSEAVFSPPNCGNTIASLVK